MKSIIEIARTSKGEIFKRGTFAVLIAVGLTLASKMIFGRDADEEDLCCVDETTEVDDDDENSDEE